MELTEQVNEYSALRKLSALVSNHNRLIQIKIGHILKAYPCFGCIDCDTAVITLFFLLFLFVDHIHLDECYLLFIEVENSAVRESLFIV